jgi:hypothetical protein
MGRIFMPSALPDTTPVRQGRLTCQCRLDDCGRRGLSQRWLVAPRPVTRQYALTRPAARGAFKGLPLSECAWPASGVGVVTGASTSKFRTAKSMRWFGVGLPESPTLSLEGHFCTLPRALCRPWPKRLRSGIGNLRLWYHTPPARRRWESGQFGAIRSTTSKKSIM